MPGFPVHHQLPELSQTHVHWVGDAIQPSHPLLSPSPPAFNLSQHQGIFQRVGSLHQVAKVMEFQLQHQSCQWIIRTGLGLTGLISLLSKGLSRVHSNTTVQKHPFFGAQLFLWPNSHIHTWLLEKNRALTTALKMKSPQETWGALGVSYFLAFSSFQGAPAFFDSWPLPPHPETAA